MGLPVFKAVGATWAYLARHAFDLFKALWLPAAVMMAVTLWAMPTYLAAAMEMMEIVDTSPDDPEAVLAVLGPMFGAMGAIMLAYIVTGPMLTTGALRHLIRGETLRLPFRFAFGGDELRVIGTVLALALMFLGIYLGGVLIVVAAAAGATMVNESVAAIVGGVLGLLLAIGLIWLILRWSVVFPAGYATRSLGIGQSWAATKGSVWSLLGFWIVAVITFMPIAIVIQAIAMGGFWAQYFALMPELIASGNDPEASLEFQTKMMELQASLFDMSKPGFWVYVALTYLYTMLSVAFGNVASGVAYRFLTGETGGEAA